MVTIKQVGAVMRNVVGWIAAAAAALAVATPAAASTITYYHNDLAGSPVVATNSSAQVIWRESYRPYGERLTKSASAKANDVWFTSRRQDSTGLVYMGARYYDPVTGRFVSTDPKGFDETNILSFGRYTYANDNPYKYVDPNGRSGVLVAEGVAIGLAVWWAVGTPEQTRRQQTESLLRGIQGLLIWANSENKDSAEDSKKAGGADQNGGEAEQREKTPSSHPDDFENVRGTKAKRDKETGEIWEKDRLHKDHYEVYDNKKDYDKGKRDRSVWEDGRPKDQF
jgi:RHS repeat-associated protein